MIRRNDNEVSFKQILNIFYCTYEHTNGLGQKLVTAYRVPFLSNNMRRKIYTQNTKKYQHCYKKYLV